MKKTRSPSRTPRPAAAEVLPEYDFSQAKSNPYAARFREGATVVAIDSGVVDIFRTSADVNDALRALAQLIRAHGKRRRDKI